MSEQHTRPPPTPPSGTTIPSMASPSVPTDPTERLLFAIESVDRKLDQKNKDDEARFARLESESATMRGVLTDLQSQVENNTKLIGSQAVSLTSVAAAAARAADIAHEAKRSSGMAVDEATKIVKSAIEIHGLSVATTVDAAVQKAVKPLSDEVVSLQSNDRTQNAELAQIKSMLVTVVKAVGHPTLRRVLIVCACIGALAGGFAAGYFAERATDQKTDAPAR